MQHMGPKTQQRCGLQGHEVTLPSMTSERECMMLGLWIHSMVLRTGSNIRCWEALHAQGKVLVRPVTCRTLLRSSMGNPA